LSRVLCKKTVLRVERYNSLIPKGLVTAQAVFYVKTDVEGRRHRSRTGFETPVVFADNAECRRLDIIWSINENASISPQE
jgi:hypothetical protein